MPDFMFFSRWRYRILSRAAAILAGTAVVLIAPLARAEDRAVIVGVNSYPYVPGMDLRKAVSDARKFYGFARDHLGFTEDQITLLLDTDATKPALQEVLMNRVILETSPGDRVLFYFSGHGSRIPDLDQDESDERDEAIVLSDVAGPYSNGQMSDDDLRQVFEAIPDRDVMVVVDACHSGTITRATGGDTLVRAMTLPDSPPPLRDATPDIRQRSNGEGPLLGRQEHMAVWSAVGPSEYAIEDRDGGVFTRFFLEGVAQKRADSNGNGLVSNAELLNFVRTRSAEFCRGSKSCAPLGRQMTPDFAGKMSNWAAFSGPPVALPGVAPANTSPAAPSQPVTPQPASVTDLFVQQNPADLSVRLRPGTRLRIGDTVTFDISATRGGHLVLLDLNPRGELFQIYPSDLSAEQVGPGQDAWSMGIPNARPGGTPVRIRASEPAGQGQLIALLMEEPIEGVLSLLPEHASLKPIPNAQRHLEMLAEHLNALKATANGTSTYTWSAHVLDYTISR